MTRKDYKRIAEVIRTLRTYSDYGTVDRLHDRLVLELSKMFAADNPRFDAAKFQDACENGPVDWIDPSDDPADDEESRFRKALDRFVKATPAPKE